MRRYLSSPHSLIVMTLAVLIAPAGESVLAAGRRAPRSSRPPTSVWAIQVPYGKATAHEPNFQNKKVWPFLTGKEYFLKTIWPKAARTLVWAHPGASAGGRTNLDPLDPKNWTDVETGKPAKSLPDMDTDVILPAADKHYIIDWQNAGHGHEHWGPPLEARCVTIGANADFRISDAKVRGNVWVRRGGFFQVDVTFFALGSDHTFFRNDNTCVRPGTGDGGGDGTYLCQYLMFNKSTREASTEFLGMLHTGDEFQIVRGTMIVGPDTVMEMGREASPYIEKNGRIALLDNAYLGKWTIDFHCSDLKVRGGTFQAGLADRPLTRSAVFRISHKNHTAATYKKPIGDDDGEPEYAHKLQRVPGIVLRAGSTIRTYSTNVAKAHLVITQLPADYPITFLRPPLGTTGYAQLAKDPRRKAFMNWLNQLPKGIDIGVCKDVTINGVEFDWIRKGGLMLQDKSAKAQWKNVFWGRNNLAPTNKLIGDLPPDLIKGREY